MMRCIVTELERVELNDALQQQQALVQQVLSARLQLCGKNSMRVGSRLLHLVRTEVRSPSVSVTYSAVESASPMRVTSPGRKRTPCCLHRCSSRSRNRRRHTLQRTD